MNNAAQAELVDTHVDRRADARHVAVMLIAKLSCGHSQTICRIRNISAMGARIVTLFPLTPGDSIGIELRSDLKMDGKVMWFRDSNSGVQFDVPIDVSRYLLRPESKIDRIKVRAPRYHCIADAIVRSDSGSLSCKITDIGLSGAGLVDLPDKAALRPGYELKLETDGISAHHATVAWIADRRAGLKFRHPLKYTELQDWLSAATRLICRPEKHVNQMMSQPIALFAQQG